MRKNQFNTRKSKNVKHIVAMPGLSQGKRGHSKVVISVWPNPINPVCAKYKPRAQLSPRFSKARERTSSKLTGRVTQFSTWDAFEGEPEVIIHEMDFEPVDGPKHSTKVWN